MEFPDLPGTPKRDNTFESLDSWGSGTLTSGFSDVTLRGVREGELVFGCQLSFLCVLIQFVTREEKQCKMIKVKIS